MASQTTIFAVITLALTPAAGFSLSVPLILALDHFVWDFERGTTYLCSSPNLPPEGVVACALFPRTMVLLDVNDRHTPNSIYETVNNPDGTQTLACGYWEGQQPNAQYCSWGWAPVQHVHYLSVGWCSASCDATHRSSGSIHDYLNGGSSLWYWVTVQNGNFKCSESGGSVSWVDGYYGSLSQDFSPGCESGAYNGLWKAYTTKHWH